MLKIRRFKVALFGILVLMLPLWAGAQDALPTLNPGPLPLQTPEVVPFLVTVQPTPYVMDKISYGRAITGEILPGTEHYYSFDGNTGDAIHIGSLNYVCIRLVSPSGTQLANNTPVLGSYLGIVIALLPETGVYQLIVGGMCEGGVEGNYQIQLRLVSYQLLEYGDSVEGSLARDPQLFVYQFEASADDIIFIGLKSEGSGFTFNLLNSKSNIPIVTASTPYNPFIGPLKITEDGLYTLLVSNQEWSNPTPFTLYIDRPVAQPIQFGVPQEVNFTGEEFLYAYSFTGGYGQMGRLWVNSGGSIDTRLLIFTPSIPMGMDEDDDSGSGYDPELEFFHLSNPIQDHNYYVWLLPRTPGNVGHVELGLDLLEPLRIDQAVVEFIATEKQPTHYLVFEGQAGESVELLIEVIQGTNRGLSVSVYQGDQTLAIVGSNFVSTLTLSLEPVEDGDVLVSVSTNLFFEAKMRVSLIRGE